MADARDASHSDPADGKRLHVFELDPYAAEIVRRILAEFLAGKATFAIAEGLTADGILSPSAYDPACDLRGDPGGYRSDISLEAGRFKI